MAGGDLLGRLPVCKTRWTTTPNRCYNCGLNLLCVGCPIAGFQLQQEKLVWMASEITKAQMVAHRRGRLTYEGRTTAISISLGKRNNIWVARECSRLAREILGVGGITDEYRVGRHFCNLEAVRLTRGGTTSTPSSWERPSRKTPCSRERDLRRPMTKSA